MCWSSKGNKRSARDLAAVAVCAFHIGFSRPSKLCFPLAASQSWKPGKNLWRNLPRPIEISTSILILVMYATHVSCRCEFGCASRNEKLCSCMGLVSCILCLLRPKFTMFLHCLNVHSCCCMFMMASAANPKLLQSPAHALLPNLWAAAQSQHGCTCGCSDCSAPTTNQNVDFFWNSPKSLAKMP